MAFIYQYYTTSYWNGTDPGVKTQMGIKNAGTISAVIEKVYVKNIISNYQESISYKSFCIHLRDYNYEGMVNVEDTSYKIPYPSYYHYELGNNYPGTPLANNWVLASSNHYYKTLKKFTLNGGLTWNFNLAFNPKNRLTDFYRAELVIQYKIGAQPSSVEKFKIKANYVNTIRAIDGKEIPEIVMEVNGVSASNIFLIQ